MLKVRRKFSIRENFINIHTCNKTVEENTKYLI